MTNTSVTEDGHGDADEVITPQIRAVIEAHGRLSVDAASIAEDADLFRLGLTSAASVSVMLGLESAFDLEFPDEMLRREIFQSIAAIREAITGLLSQASGR